MKRVFLDTVGLLALWDSTDQWHETAKSALDAVGSVRTITTTFILLECGNAAARRPYRNLVDEMRLKLEKGGKLITPTAADWQEAGVAYTRSGPGSAGIVDQISFLVMRRLGIQDVFTNDRHFKAAGFTTLF
jgi:predicted nucleic acid-binding protein